jgi:hypothetical protein
MMKADALHVFKLPGWEESKGVQFEINWWKSMTPPYIAKETLQYIDAEKYIY